MIKPTWQKSDRCPVHKQGTGKIHKTFPTKDYPIKMQVLDRKQRVISIPILRGASGAEVAYRRFSGFRSRCTTPFSCRYCTQRQTGVNIHHIQPFRQQLPLRLQVTNSIVLFNLKEWLKFIRKVFVRLQYQSREWTPGGTDGFPLSQSIIRISQS